MVSKCELPNGNRDTWNNLTFGTHRGSTGHGYFGVRLFLSFLKRGINGLHLKHLCHHGAYGGLISDKQ